MRVPKRLGVTIRPATGEDEWREFAQSLALQLRRLRLRTGLSQEEVAHRANLSRFIYRQYENGESRRGFPANPALRSIIAIAQVFEEPIEELLPSPLPDLRSRQIAHAYRTDLLAVFSSRFIRLLTSLSAAREMVVLHEGRLTTAPSRRRPFNCGDGDARSPSQRHGLGRGRLRREPCARRGPCSCRAASTYGARASRKAVAFVEVRSISYAHPSTRNDMDSPSRSSGSPLRSSTIVTVRRIAMHRLHCAPEYQPHYLVTERT